MVLRLFNLSEDALSLESLGLSAAQLAILLLALAQPQGLILVTGPTGSGKSTTLYCALQHLNTGDLNIVTAEDPVEIKIAGISQVPIKNNLGFTFAAALRTFLRQDPDVMMIGEIRDEETAHIALQAAQTGHLVLSTLHTADCFRTLTRLSMLNIDTSLLADSLLLVVSQRLLRYANSSGRFPIFEMLPISCAMQSLIRERASPALLEAQGLSEGFVSLHTAAMEKVSQGFTTEAEVLRVIGRPS